VGIFLNNNNNIVRILLILNVIDYVYATST